MRADRNPGRSHASAQFFTRSCTCVVGQTVRNRERCTGSTVPIAFIRAGQRIQCMVSHVSIQLPALRGKRIPPEDVSLEPPWRDEDRGRKRTLHELAHSLAHRSAIRVVQRNGYARPTVSVLIDLIEGSNVRKFGDHVELSGEVALSDEKRSLSTLLRAVGLNAVIGQNQALPSYSGSGYLADPRGGKDAFDRPLQTWVHSQPTPNEPQTGRANRLRLVLRAIQHGDLAMGTVHRSLAFLPP